MRHWRGRVAGFVAGLLLGGWLIATPAAQSYVWGAINGIPFGPGLVLSGPVLLPDGSAAATALGFSAEPNTGIRRAAAGILRFGVLGSDRMDITANGMALYPTSLTGSSAISAQTIAQTWNTTGAPVLVDWTITDTASDAASLAFRIRGGAAGTTELFKVSKAGVGTFASSVISGSILQAGADSGIAWSGRSRMASPSSGTWSVMTADSTGFTTANFGPTTGNTASGTTSITHVNATIDAATATGTGTGTLTVSNFFPAGCTLDTFSGRVTTVLAGAGLTTWSIGTGGATTVLGTTLAVAANTLVNGSTFTANPTTTFYGGAAKDLVLTAAAGVFSTGVVKVTATCVYATPIGS